MQRFRQIPRKPASSSGRVRNAESQGPFVPENTSPRSLQGTIASESGARRPVKAASRPHEDRATCVTWGRGWGPKAGLRPRGPPSRGSCLQPRPRLWLTCQVRTITSNEESKRRQEETAKPVGPPDPCSSPLGWAWTCGCLRLPLWRPSCRRPSSLLVAPTAPRIRPTPLAPRHLPFLVATPPVTGLPPSAPGPSLPLSSARTAGLLVCLAAPTALQASAARPSSRGPSAHPLMLCHTHVSSQTVLVTARFYSYLFISVHTPTRHL